MTDNTYWAIVCKNYHGGDETYYFTSHEVARENFVEIINNHQSAEEFRKDGDSCSWFDCRFNEYSTHIYLTEKPLPEIHDDIIF